VWGEVLLVLASWELKFCSADGKVDIFNLISQTALPVPGKEVLGTIPNLWFRMIGSDFSPAITDKLRRKEGRSSTQLKGREGPPGSNSTHNKILVQTSLGSAESRRVGQVALHDIYRTLGLRF